MKKTFLCSIGLLGLVLSKATFSAPTASFDGVWLVSSPIEQLTTIEGKAPPLLDSARELHAKRLAQFKAADHSYDSTLWCKPMGEPRTAYDPEGGLFEIRTNPKVVLFTYTWNRMVRFITLSDEAVDVIGPSYYGTANGHWDNDTLIVDAQGFQEGTLLDASGLPHSEELRMVQRYRLIDNGNSLEEIIRFEDPLTFSAPWQARVIYQRQPEGTRIPEDVCLERRGITDY